MCIIIKQHLFSTEKDRPSQTEETTLQLNTCTNKRKNIKDKTRHQAEAADKITMFCKVVMLVYSLRLEGAGREMSSMEDREGGDTLLLISC